MRGSVLLQPAMDGSLVHDLPRGSRQQGTETRFMLSFFRCREIVRIEIDDIDVLYRGGLFIAVQMIPDQRPNDTRSDAPAGKLQLADGAQCGHQAGRAFDQFDEPDMVGGGFHAAIEATPRRDGPLERRARALAAVEAPEVY